MNWPVWIAAGVALLGIGVLAIPHRHTRSRLRRMRDGSGGADLRTAVRRFLRRAERSARAAVVLGAAAGGTLGLLLGGPVAAMILAAYAGFAARALLTRRRQESATRARGEAVDAVAALADDLRAGLAPRSALGRAWPRLVGADTPADGPADTVVPDDPVRALRGDAEPARAPVALRLATAWRLADRTGTPLAELLDRLDAELAAQERVRRRFAAQTAGTRATALLLAVLPAIGLAFGYSIGADPLRVLLHSPVGAICAAITLVLQLAGSFWVRRLAATGAVGEPA
jgi:tight adherence protein B